MRNEPFLLVLLLMIIVSCNTQDVCDEDSQSIMVARFRSQVSGEIKDTVLQGITIYGIRNGFPDSLLYNSVSAAKVSLPLDPNHDQSRYVLLSGAQSDTLVLKHSSEAYLISYSCGFAMRFTIGNFSSEGNLITGMELIKASVDAENEINEEHLWIYF